MMKAYPRYHKTASEIDLMILKDCIDSGNMSHDETLKKNIMSRREEIIKKHEEHHSIWQNKTNLKWYTKLGAEKRLLVRKERSDLENAIVEFYLTDEKQAATVDDVFQNWIQYETARTDHAMKTINEYTYEYNRYLAETDFASSPIHEVTEQDIVKLLTSIVQEGKKVPLKRFKAIKTVIRTIFNHAKIHMELECISVKNIMDDLHFPSSAFKETTMDDSAQIFKLSEIRLMKNALKDTNDLLELGILLTIETGVRVGELCVLKRDCITNDCLLIRASEHKAKFEGKYRYYIDSPKKDKSRSIILNNDAKQIIKKILSLHDSDWLFPNKENTSDWMHTYQFDRAIRRICRRLGIQERSMHKIRKTYASCLLAQKEAGVTDKIVQGQLGHADISTTHQAYYYDVFDEEEKVNILSTVRIG